MNRFLDVRTDPAGELWVRAVGWKRGDAFGVPIAAPVPGFRWTDDWDYTAFLGHFVTGLHDVHEHTFDAWERPGKEGDQELLVTGYRIEEVARAFGLTVEDADQWLAYRTLHTQVPWSLLAYFDQLHEAWENDPTNRFPHVPATEPGRTIALRFDASPGLPATEAPYRIVEELDLTFAAEDHPTANGRAARFLDLALTYDEVSWPVLYEDAGPTALRFRPEGLEKLRAAITDEDVSGRIGTPEEGAYSDRALRLLLRARIENLAAPPALWAAILQGDGSGLADDGWRLALPPVYSDSVEEVAA